ncbi:MAG: sodium:solute symporter family protein [Dehalococcoidales bacterium]|jgi:SSS family solute:Na+ symporter|nr:sodium:solute symporter family protein [Dehalococcoidales bacterium]
MLELFIIIFYFLAVILIGILSRRKHWGLDDFFVSRRRQSTVFVTGSLLATIIGGSATLGMAGLGFSRGLTGIWWLLAGSIGLMILGIFLAKKVRDAGLYTLPELIEKQYDRRAALAASILIVLAWTAVIAGQIIAAGKIFSILGAGNSSTWMIIFTLTFVAYVIIGGQYAVIRTDLLQAILIFGGIFAAGIFLLVKIGGPGSLYSSLPPDSFSFPLSSKFGVRDLLTYLLITGSTYVVGPDIYSRLFCAKDSRTARRSVFFAAGMLIPVALMIVLIGMGALVLFPQTAPEQAFPVVIKNLFPPFLGGLVLAALISAVMSSADTTVLSASIILTRDIFGFFKPAASEKSIINLTRLSVLVLGLIALALALVLQGVISALLFAYTIYTCGVIVPVIMGFYKDKLQLTPLSALIAMIAGGLAGLTSKIWQIPYLDLIALPSSGSLLYLVSLLDRKLRSRTKISMTFANTDA